MGLRALLVGVIVVATVAFVVGTVVERDESGHHDEATEAVPGAVDQPAAGEEENSEAGGESAVEHATESTGAAASSAESSHEELRPLRIDIEAWPFVALAVIVSLALAAAAWLRPCATLILGITAVLMVAFAALDIREVIHQLDVDESALAVLSAIIAALHIGAAAIAALMISRSRHAASAAPSTTRAKPA